MHTCAIISCGSRSGSKNIKLFRIPTDEEEAKGWIRFVTEANSGVIPHVPSGKIFICSKHFRKCCIYPCNPCRSRLVTGHFPSVIDENVIINPNSKCALISSDENLKVYTQPSYRNAQEMQRAYLVKKLTSFGVQRKIVIGKGTTSPIMKIINEKNREFENEMPMQPEQSETDLAQTEFLSRLALQPHTSDCNVVGASKELWFGDLQNGNKRERVLQKNPKRLAKGLVFPIKQEGVDTKVERKTSKKSLSTRPSSETKMRLLIRDNVNLKKSVQKLETRVEEMEKEYKKLKDTSSDLETRYNKLLNTFQRRLKRKKSKVGRNSSVTTVSNCKCALIELVDISHD